MNQENRPVLLVRTLSPLSIGVLLHGAMETVLPRLNELGELYGSDEMEQSVNFFRQLNLVARTAEDSDTIDSSILRKMGLDKNELALFEMDESPFTQRFINTIHDLVLLMFIGAKQDLTYLDSYAVYGVMDSERVFHEE